MGQVLDTAPSVVYRCLSFFFIHEFSPTLPAVFCLWCTLSSCRIWPIFSFTFLICCMTSAAKTCRYLVGSIIPSISGCHTNCCQTGWLPSTLAHHDLLFCFFKLMKWKAVNGHLKNSSFKCPSISFTLKIKHFIYPKICIQLNTIITIEQTLSYK